MIFGEKHSFAIECTPGVSFGPDLYGQFLFWINHTLVGDQEEDALLRACASYLNESVQFQGKRHEPEFDSLTAEQLFSILYDSMKYYPPAGKTIADTLHEESDEEFHEPPYGWCDDRFHLDHVGMSSFIDTVGIILVEASDGGERLIWRSYRDWQIHEAILQPGQFEGTAREFLQWIRAVHGIGPGIGAA